MEENNVDKVSILITGGGSGKLGSYLCQSLLNEKTQVSYTYHRTADPALQDVPCLQVDLSDKGDAGEADKLVAFLQQVKPSIIINCAAIPRPNECEANPEQARSLNIPSLLIKSLGKSGFLPTQVLIVQISTDLVYDGKTSTLYVETDPQPKGEKGMGVAPLNVYGQSKLEAEEMLVKEWGENVVCLRSSMIYGQGPGFFTSFVDSVLAEKKATEFFVDEFRSPVFIGDFVKAVESLMRICIMPNKTVQQAGLRNVYNFGGPERLSREEMAKKICSLRGYDAQFIKPSSAEGFNRGAVSPRDTGMDSSRAATDLAIRMTPFDEGIKACFT